MKKNLTLQKEQVQKVDKVQVLNVPDEVYVSTTGVCYYPEATKAATIKISYEDAVKKGYKPSKQYFRFLEQLANEQSEKDYVESE